MENKNWKYISTDDEISLHDCVVTKKIFGENITLCFEDGFDVCSENILNNTGKHKRSSSSQVVLTNAKLEKFYISAYKTTDYENNSEQTFPEIMLGLDEFIYSYQIDVLDFDTSKLQEKHKITLFGTFHSSEKSECDAQTCYAEISCDQVIYNWNDYSFDAWFQEKPQKEFDPEELIIRKINVYDFANLSELYTNLNGNSPFRFDLDSCKIWSRILADENYNIIVAEKNKEIISSCTIIIVPNLTHDMRPYALIENVVTAENHRNKGYATACLNFANEIALKNNCYKIMLMTGSKSENVDNFYRKAGYNSSDKTAYIKWL